MKDRRSIVLERRKVADDPDEKRDWRESDDHREICRRPGHSDEHLRTRLRRELFHAGHSADGRKGDIVDTDAVVASHECMAKLMQENTRKDKEDENEGENDGRHADSGAD